MPILLILLNPSFRAAAAERTRIVVMASIPEWMHLCRVGKRKRSPSTVEIGGGQPVLTATGVSVPADAQPGSPGRGEFKLSMDGEALQHGREIRELFVAAIRREDIRELGRLVKAFSFVAYRLPELWDYLNFLVANRRAHSVDRILEESRGRPRDTPFYVIGLVDAVLARDGGSVANAAKWIARNHRLGIGDRTIENLYSRHKRLHDLYRWPRYFPADELTPTKWTK